MSGSHAALAHAALSAARGCLDAQRLVQELRRGHAPAGALQAALEAVVELNDAERTRGFLREIEKAIERTVGVEGRC